MTDFSGDWNSYYRYPSTSRGDDYWGQNILHAKQHNTRLTFETGAESPEHILIELELSGDDTVAKGVWAEDTDPDGYYKGRRYEGTIELKISKNGERLSGVWHGAGSDGTMHSDIWELVRAKQPKATAGLPKRWHATYWYPSNTSIGDKPSGYEMKGYWTGNTLVLESIPNDEQSYMLIRLKVEGTLATGNWYESTAPAGEFKGAQYSGAGQLIVNQKTHHMEGLWAGAGFNQKNKKPQIYTGRWKIAPSGEGRRKR